MATPLGLQDLTASSAGKHGTVNLNNLILDRLQVGVLTRTPGGPPGSPANGAFYIVDSATGAWSAYAVGSLAFYYGGLWYNINSEEGLTLWINDEDLRYVFDGAAWVNDGAVTVATLGASTGSALVGHIATGAGAVATTVQAVLREKVSVLGFGADNTGVADSYAAFASAITAALVVEVPPGTYQLSSGLNLSGRALVGAGKGAVTINYTGSDYAVRVSGWSAPGKLVGVKIVGTGSGDCGVKVYEAGVGAKYCIVDDVHISGFTNAAAAGMRITGEVNAGVYYNLFKNISSIGNAKAFVIGTAGWPGDSSFRVNSNMFISCDGSESTNGAGFTFEGCTGDTFYNCNRELNSTYGVSVTRGINIHFIGGYSENNTSGHFYVPDDVNVSYFMSMMEHFTGASMGTIFAGRSHFVQNGEMLVGGLLKIPSLFVEGNTQLGDAAGDTVTFTGTAVSIPNGLNFDSNTLSLDAANNRVGINVAAPLYNLHISNSASSGTAWTAADDIVLTGSAGNNIGMTLLSQSGGSVFATLAFGTELNNTAGRLTFATATAQLDISSAAGLTFGVQDASNFGFGIASWGTSAAKVIAVGSGTAPTTSPADAFQIWAADRGGTAGKSGLHVRSEDGTSHVWSDRIGLMTATPSTDIGIGGQTSRTMAMERHTTSNTAGNPLTVQSGGATSGATDKDAGMLTLAPGVSTGTGKASVRLQALTRAAATGTSDNALFDAFILPAVKNITDGVAVGLFEVTLPTLTGSGGRVIYTIFATDGVDMQIHSGHATWAAVNKGGVYTTQITDSSVSNDADAASSGTLTDTWTVTTGTNKVTVNVNANSSLTPTAMWISYSIQGVTPQAITQL